MTLSEALDRVYRYNDSMPVTFAAAYWVTLGIVLAPLFYGLNQSTAAAAGAFGPVSIVLAAAILLITILGISFYFWLYLTNPYRLPLDYLLDLYYGIRLFALIGFGVIALVAFLVWQVGGPS
jgi:hypothetical protein